ncbi:MAG: YkgJ family cysteine cluster protein [Gammaproteobacteria bacterium]|nr:YkgJ family cysteine cluster protein [Gammaproteobacteria bacterium]
MNCREGCGACCIAPSINQSFKGMPNGKPANTACVHLDAAMRCGLFGQPERPSCCAGLRPSTEMCGSNREYALQYLGNLESLTRP